MSYIHDIIWCFYALVTCKTHFPVPNSLYFLNKYYYQKIKLFLTFYIHFWSFRRKGPRMDQRLFNIQMFHYLPSLISYTAMHRLYYTDPSLPIVFDLLCYDLYDNIKLYNVRECRGKVLYRTFTIFFTLWRVVTTLYILYALTCSEYSLYSILSDMYWLLCIFYTLWHVVTTLYTLYALTCSDYSVYSIHSDMYWLLCIFYMLWHVVTTLYILYSLTYTDYSVYSIHSDM